MCLIVAAWRAHPEYPLIVAANRDEQFARPAAAAHWWPDVPHVLAGRDLVANGTWLGITRTGRFAALTNYRDPARKRDNAPSRGQLVRDGLTGSQAAAHVLQQVAKLAPQYADFNFFFSDGKEFGIHESAAKRTRLLGPGVHALSNHLLGTPWPKVELARRRFEAALAMPLTDETFLALLRDDTPATDDCLPSTGVSLEWERWLSPVFVRAPGYGTRCSTLLQVRADGNSRLREWTWDENAQAVGDVEHHFHIKPPET